MQVLIAGVAPVTRRLIMHVLGRLGHECIVRDDGLDALDSYQRRAPDVVIVDWDVPGLSAVELCQRIRATRNDSYAYVVVLTAHSRRDCSVRALQGGADDFLEKPVEAEYLQAHMITAERVTSLHTELQKRQDELEQLNDQLRVQSRRDALTGIGNRLRMEEELSDLIERARRYKQPFAVALVDVDDFKLYNDSMGHAAGDDVLRKVAATLDAAGRVLDGVYRYGGEEFLLTFPEQMADGALIAMQRRRAVVEALALPHPAARDRNIVTISAGIAEFDPEHPQKLPEILSRADQALYRAKDDGRNRVIVWQPGRPLDELALSA